MRRRIGIRDTTGVDVSGDELPKILTNGYLSGLAAFFCETKAELFASIVEVAPAQLGDSSDASGSVNQNPDDGFVITGIGGGVATLMLQMAIAKNAQVCVTSGSEEKIEMAKKNGARGGVNYKIGDWDKQIIALTGNDGIDLIVDGAGGPGFNQLISIVKPGGKIVSYGATAGKPSDIQLHKIFWKQITIQGTTMGSNQDFEEMIKYFSNSEISPVIHKKFSLVDFRSAYLELMNGKQFGKIVLIP